jgi:alanine racemase
VRDACDGIRLTGIFTHFHSADEDADSVRTQWQRLDDALSALPWDRRSIMIHAANSAASLRPSTVSADAVRPGIFLYGGVAGRKLPQPEPVAAVRARVLLLRDASPGATLGYGATHVARGWERWATLGIGYGDGLPRSLGNRGHALLAGQRVPIIGRISMDMTVVDITDMADIGVGDVATLLGGDGPESISLEEVADLAGTINYEILTGFTQRLPRIWMDDGRG